MSLRKNKKKFLAFFLNFVSFKKISLTSYTLHITTCCVLKQCVFCFFYIIILQTLKNDYSLVLMLWKFLTTVCDMSLEFEVESVYWLQATRLYTSSHFTFFYVSAVCLTAPAQILQWPVIWPLATPLTHDWGSCVSGLVLLGSSYSKPFFSKFFHSLPGFLLRINNFVLQVWSGYSKLIIYSVN